MKVNKEVSDLARKLDYIGIDREDKRELIKKCLNPLRLVKGFYLIKEINETYEYLRKRVDEFLKKYPEPRGEIRYIALFN